MKWLQLECPTFSKWYLIPLVWRINPHPTTNDRLHSNNSCDINTNILLLFLLRKNTPYRRCIFISRHLSKLKCQCRGCTIIPPASLMEHSGYLFCLRPKHAAHWEKLQDLQKEQSLLAWVPQNYTTEVFPRTITPESVVVLQVLAEIKSWVCKKTEMSALE